MVDPELVRTTLGIIGNVISFGLFCSPIPTFVKICKNKSVEQFKPDPYVATILNCAMWVFYGLPFVHPDNVLVATTNGIGLLIEFIYVAIFFTYSTWSKRRKIIIAVLVEIIFMAVIIVVTLKCFHGTQKRSMLVGILCIILNVIMYISPLTVMCRVIRTKSVKYMPFYLSLANFFNGVAWLTYALIKFDINVVLPNGLGALSGAGQLILYSAYYKSTPRDEENKPSEV